MLLSRTARVTPAGTDPWHALRAYPMVTSCLGAGTIGFSGIFFELSRASPATGAFFRCLYALPALMLLARREHTDPARARGATRPALAAGAFLAVDLICWHHAIANVGAGLGTVLGQTQILFTTGLAVVLLGERPSHATLAGMPVVLAGVILVSGVVENAPFGRHPTLGVLYGTLAGATYAAFVLLLRASNADPTRPVRPLLLATASALVVTALLGSLLGELQWTPVWPGQGWLVALALSSQVIGWLLISIPIFVLPASVTAIVLSLQPASAVVFSMLILSERPSGLQLLGAALVAVGFVAATIGRTPRARTGAGVPP